jgi:hypothetical protein
MKGLKYPCLLCLHPFHILVPEQYPSPNNSFNANPTRRRTERLAGARTGGRRPTRAARAGLARPARVGGLGRGWLECARAGRGQLKRVRARCGHRECVRGAEETSASDARKQGEVKAARATNAGVSLVSGDTAENMSATHF